MPLYTCEKCAQTFKQKNDYVRHTNKKYPCITREELDKKIKDSTTNVLINDDTKINNELHQIEHFKKDDHLYDTELKRLQDELKDEIYLYVFNALETNIKFKKFYEDTVSKLFLKLFSLCQRKIIKAGDKEEYKRDWILFDGGKVKSNDLVKKKLIGIFKENELYFNKRLLKYAKNVVIELYDIKYIDLSE